MKSDEEYSELEHLQNALVNAMVWLLERHQATATG
jgi:hypothetical protein